LTSINSFVDPTSAGDSVTLEYGFAGNLIGEYNTGMYDFATDIATIPFDAVWALTITLQIDNPADLDSSIRAYDLELLANGPQVGLIRRFGDSTFIPTGAAETRDANISYTCIVFLVAGTEIRSRFIINNGRPGLNTASVTAFFSVNLIR